MRKRQLAGDPAAPTDADQVAEPWSPTGQAAPVAAPAASAASPIHPGAGSPGPGRSPDPARPKRTWHWGFALFRAADGSTVAVIPLTVALHYDLGIAWVAGVAAAMNLAGVPAGMAWAKLIEGGRYRRRLAFFAFLAAGAALAVLALLPPFPLFLSAAILFAVAGIATAPAAGVLALEGVPKKEWGSATGALGRHVGAAYLLGVALAVGLGLSGVAVAPIMFWVAAISCMAAAVVATRTIPRFAGIAPVRRFDRAAVQSGQRRFERAVWLPARIRNRPTWRGLARVFHGPDARLLAATFLLFAGALVVLASYPGVLAHRMQLSAGVVLLAQAPSFVASSLSYQAAGRIGDRIGLMSAMRVGAVLRLFSVPAMAVVVLAWGAHALVAVLILHAAFGVAFAFLSVNGPCLAAELRPDARGDAVGAFHAVSGLGVMAGSLLSASIIAFGSLEASYLVAVLLIIGGAVLMFARERHA